MGMFCNYLYQMLFVNLSYIYIHEVLKQVMDAKWKFASTYSVGSAATIEERMPVWYLMDEFGSRIQHSDDFNFRLVLHIVSFCEFMSGFEKVFF